MLKEGEQAPLFSLPASNGTVISLEDFKNKNRVVLYFYPKDDTPGCTVEACGFRDEIDAFISQNAVVLGVSPDPIKHHEKFIKKFDLPFILLSDEDKKTCQDYGVWIEKSMYGRKYMGVDRKTFVIEKDGTILKIFHKVKPDGHNLEVLETLLISPF
ncbi:MAG: thioredoxin-dependent thiol peroxidase [Candidatus Omnitrophica bacterium]|nr:thioredoxin-dependent thiol peroxidase [Candidatus Omnitrophota bacterium]